MKKLNARLIMWTVCIWVFTALATPGQAQDAKKEEAAQQEDAAKAESFTPSNSYVHKWIKIPEVTGQNVMGTGKTTIAHRKGRATVVYFIASFDEGSQQLLNDLQRVERKYNKLHTDFYYVFVHDTQIDAAGFMQEFKMNDGMLDNHNILKAFHHSDLPAVYLGDRQGWLSRRFVAARRSDVEELDRYLDLLNAM